MKKQPVGVVWSKSRVIAPMLSGLAVASCCLSLALLSGCNSAVASNGSKAPSASEVAARLAKETAGLKPITGPIDFNAQIRPIMSSGCFACHGPDANMRKAGLRLDYADPAEAALPDHPDRHAIVPGHPELSDVIRRITSPNPDVRMPHGAPALKPAQVQLIAQWVKQGAKYEPIWSLIPPKLVPVPSVGALQSRVVNPIDSFVFARLAQNGMSPSPEADRATLINRVSLTLTGLPPTLAQVDAFVNDKSPNAYENVVDRLLASSAYGEHMAGMWMDLSRYADSNGYEEDGVDPNLWPWRDWVINSFNQNMSFDKFATMQVAGDLMPHRNRDDLVATEFLRLGLRAQEAGDLNEQYRIETVVDDTDTVGQALLGYTVGCARCHDHKFDPISQKDFYSLSGFFNSLDAPGVGGTGGGPTLPWPTAAQQVQLLQAQRKVNQTSDAYQHVMAADVRQDASEVAEWLRSPGESGVASASSEPAHLVRTSLVQPGEGAAQGPVSDAALHLIQSSLQQAQVAYYPFDSVQPIPKSAWPMLRLKGQPFDFSRFGLPYPRKAGAQAPKFGARRPGVRPGATRVALASKGKPKGPKAAAKPAVDNSPGGYETIGGIGLDGKQNTLIPATYKLSEMVFSPSGMPNGLPAVVSMPKLGPGVKGKALYFIASNASRTYLPHEMGQPSLGYYDRWNQYSVDMWFYPAKRYPEYTTVFNQSRGPDADTVDNGGQGYELVLLEDGRLEFFISHARPFNMLAVATKAPLPLKQWAHIAVTYDGSSKAAGVHLYIDGAPVPVDVVKDNLTEGGLPTASPGFFDEYTGFEFGTRHEETGPVDSAIDEFRLFDRALTPIEIAYLHQGAQALKTVDRSSLSGQLAHLLAIRDPAAIRARQALEMARKQEDGVAKSIPAMLVYEDQPTPRPTYLLYRGDWDARREQVPLQG
ncbi:MAG: DUF1549 domain-containing protein, partial [Steroidobacteraceae bacterium]